MTTFLFWLAIPLGFSGLPVSAFGIVLLPFAVVSLFNDFAAPRDVVWAMFGIAIVTVVPTIQRLSGFFLTRRKRAPRRHRYSARKCSHRLQQWSILLTRI
jgi:hypothetical protein